MFSYPSFLLNINVGPFRPLFGVGGGGVLTEFSGPAPLLQVLSRNPERAGNRQ